MAESSRPPSEQGVEYRTLDLLEQLAIKVEALAGQRQIISLHGNWWDVLPDLRRDSSGAPSWAEILANGTSYVNQLPCRRSDWLPILRAFVYEDRLELSIQVQGGAWTVWQRALFYERGPHG